MTDYIHQVRASGPRPAQDSRDLGTLALLFALVALALGGGALVHQLALRDRADAVEHRVDRLDAEHPTDEGMEAARRAAIARAVEEGRRDLAGAEKEVRR